MEKSIIENMYSGRKRRERSKPEVDGQRPLASSMVKSQYTTMQKERAEIEDRVNNEHITPSDEEQKVAKEITGGISQQFAEEMHEKSIDELGDKIKDAVRRTCESLVTTKKLTFEQGRRVEKIVLMTVLGNGPIQELLIDPEVTEIVVQRYDNIVIEKRGKIIRTDIRFNNEEHLETIIKRIVQRCGKQISTVMPIVDARLLDGSRVNATLRPVSVDGATLTIRKFSDNFLSGEDYLAFGSLNENMLKLIAIAIRAKITMFVSGGTGTGKTTMLNLLSSYIPDDELIITIEDTCELKLQQPNVRRMEVRRSKTPEMMDVDQQALVKAALRQRPDRIVLGEVRDGSIVDLISAMSTGHEGSMSTIHANSPDNMCNVRIPILYSQNKEASFSEKSIALQIAEAVQMIIQISRFPDGSRKVTNISYIDGVSDDKVLVKDIFIYNKQKNRFEFTGNRPEKIIRIIREKGIEFDESIFETAAEDFQQAETEDGTLIKDSETGAEE